jgi:hypothetical protein
MTVVLAGGSLIGAGGFFYLALIEPVLWMEIGEQLRYRKLGGVQTRKWSDVHEMIFEDEQSKVMTKIPGVAIPIGSHRVLVIMLNDGSQLRVKVTSAQEVQIRRTILPLRDRPYLPEDFPCAVQPTGPSGRRCGISTLGEEPTIFRVTFGEYLSRMFTDDPEEMPLGTQLDLAFRASLGAEIRERIQVGHENLTGLFEDDYEWYEWRVNPTQANVAALRAVGLAWDDDARRLADQLLVREEVVDEVRQTMRRLAQQDLRDLQRIIG